MRARHTGLNTGLNTGFTLIELLVAITLLAVIAVLSWRGLDSLMRGRDAIVSEEARLRALNRTFSQLDSDCAALADAQALQRSPVLLEPNRLVLIRDRREPQQPAQWQVVTYALDTGRVIRTASAPLPDTTQLAAALQAGATVTGPTAATSVALVEDATQLSARAWIEPGGWVARSTAVDAALQPPPAVAGQTPATPVIRAVELSLDVATGGSTPQRYAKTCLTGR
ncbi:prepilin-type N-terminal cleavage/methylation domain-containing protein [Imbroritus primus]|uniref:Prepilin-type N-terminal cleavage/methylation domain-containing protein n=1 Tax=Imbroritus primus TaxID=3058603 RepID=A0ACD3SNP0_9BURK|nr:prepilin-type N-terminal cleavage/methylation domain-containing protein [Burkholderiaceae bacterium PBA]